MFSFSIFVCFWQVFQKAPFRVATHSVLTEILVFFILLFDFNTCSCVITSENRLKLVIYFSFRFISYKMIILSIINQQGPNYFLLNQKLVSEFILKLILFMNKCIFLQYITPCIHVVTMRDI